jgi:hypothetical protein
MITFKYVYDRCSRQVSIIASASPTYNGVPTELEARIALARKLDGDIAAQKVKMEREIAALTQELNDLEGLRNSVYVGELPAPVVIVS